MDIKEYKGVWVFCEHSRDRLSGASRELLSEGRKLADQLGTELTGILAGGQGIGSLAGEAGAYGADQVIVAEDEKLEVYTTDAYTEVLTRLAGTYKPEIILIGATNIGRDLGPRCAARLHTGLCADCTHLDVDMEVYRDFLRNDFSLPERRIEKTGTALVAGERKDVSGELKMTRPAFGGNLMATIICPRFRPVMATVRPGVMKKADPCPARAEAVRIIREDAGLEKLALRTEIMEVVESASRKIDLSEAKYIVSVGRGISRDVEQGLRIAEELAKTLGGAVAGSRAAVDSGWISPDRQVGQTGTTVRPVIYIALGISGAIQHKIGMKDSACIIAVNKDPSAPIFEIADYGIVGDLYKTAPLLAESIAEARGRD